MQKGKRVAPQIQRSRSDDLLASVFPHASACPETMTGDIVIPEHPLVNEVMKDTLTEAMDIEGLLEVLRGIASGAVRTVAVDTPVPSVFAHELVNAMPYAYLDGEDARRASTTSLRRALPDAVVDAAGRIDAAAIETVRAQLRPDVRDEHELHDLLLSIVALPVSFLDGHVGGGGAQHWPLFFARLQEHGRAHCIVLEDASFWIATERLPEAALLWPECSALETLAAANGVQPDTARTLAGSEERPAQTLSPRDAATLTLTQGWLQWLGPATAAQLAELLQLHPRSLHQALLAMEMQGVALRGVFEHPKPLEDEPFAIEWCERRILHRIHRLTLGTLRKQVEPAAPAVFMRWLLDWHGLAPQSGPAQPGPSGEEAVLAAIEQLEGFEAPAIEWERTLLPARVTHYDPQWLDNLCLAGVVGWGRLSPHPAWTAAEAAAPRRVVPTTAAPITFYLRESAEWLHAALEAKSVDEAVLAQSLSAEAQSIRALLVRQGACFIADLQRLSGLNKPQTSNALWELATAGLASADGFDQLRAMMDPRRKSAALAQTAATSLRKRAAARTTAGRWSLLFVANDTLTHRANDTAAAIAAARRADAALHAHARILLGRYGVLFRELLVRESNAPKWRDMAPVLRRLEARGEVRGGRFVSGPFGEQFALPEAAEALRQARLKHASYANEAAIAVAAADPLNLAGILVPGERVPAVPGREVLFANGAAVQEEAIQVEQVKKMPRARSLAELVRAGATPLPRAPQRSATASLFP